MLVVTNKEALSDNVNLTIIEFNEWDEQFIELLEKYFVTICEGDSGSDIETVKLHVSNLFSTKNENWKIGATAEFFVHLYLNYVGYKQECLFLNLEEGSIKKGFDGYYSFQQEEWIMESKAGSICSSGISHKNKVLEATRDLSKKLSGVETGDGKKRVNPWWNALSHANNIDVNTSKNIRDNIKKLSNEFNKGLYHSIDEFNIIPCGTVFLTGVWVPQDSSKIKTDIQKAIKSLKGKQVHVICVTNKTVEAFLDYINFKGEKYDAEQNS